MEPASTHWPSQTLQSWQLRLIAAWQSLPACWRWAFSYYLFGRLLFSAWGAVIWRMGMGAPDEMHRGLYFSIEPVLDGPAGAFLGMWQRWDSIHYLRIAVEGYSATDLTAFYPLYPLLGRWLSQISGLEILPALLVVSNLALIVSLALLFETTKIFFPQAVARDALLALLLFPTSFYLYAAYPQSLLLMLILLAYWLSLRRWWLASAVVGLLAGLVHSTAALLVVLVGWQAVLFVRNAQAKLRWIVLLTPFTNLLGTALFLAWREWMGFMPYTLLQQQYFQRTINLPWAAVAAILDYMRQLPLHATYLIPWLATAVVWLVIGMTLLGARQLPRLLWIYQVVLLVFLISNQVKGTPMLAFLRFNLIMFPLYIQMAVIFQKRAWKMAGFAVGMLFALLFSAMFFAWRGDMI